MYLFVRRARLAGGQTRASMMWAEEITERVNQVTDLGFTMHAQVFSADVGELVWAAAVPDLTTLEKGVEKLQVDDFYIAEQEDGDQPPYICLRDANGEVLAKLPCPRHIHGVGVDSRGEGRLGNGAGCGPSWRH